MTLTPTNTAEHLVAEVLGGTVIERRPTMSTTFNPHGNRTSDGTVIVLGLAVIDYNRDRTTVVADRDTQQWKCCGDTAHVRANDLHPNHPEPCRRSLGCSHDHWFTTANGGMFNGSRLKAI